MNQLETLKQYTTVVADTGDINSIKAFEPQDATTNPSLLFKAAQMPEYQHLVAAAMDWAKSQSNQAQEQTEKAILKLNVLFGQEILAIVPGRVSTEVNAAYSFDQHATLNQARELIAMYDAIGIDKNRILIKIAATWPGIQAARILEQEGICCNLTLMFDKAQAIACAQNGITLISPFVGRIYDWYKKANQTEYSADNDPGVESVRSIYAYYKKFDYPTVVMGASFRNIGQIRALTGCDYLTISPGLLDDLKQNQETLEPKLSASWAKDQNIEEIKVEEPNFYWHMNQNPMATEKLAEGIRLFYQDHLKLQDYIHSQL